MKTAKTATLQKERLDEAVKRYGDRLKVAGHIGKTILCGAKVVFIDRGQGYILRQPSDFDSILEVTGTLSGLLVFDTHDVAETNHAANANDRPYDRYEICAQVESADQETTLVPLRHLEGPVGTVK